MATATELLIAANHMRKVGIPHTDRVLQRAYCEAADMLESEAQRVHAAEMKALKKSKR